jgi:YgiT-type zinc finger domain-containing protein
MRNEETAVNCVVCRGTEIELEEVVEEIKLKNDVVQVPVRVLVCRTCGERYYDRRTIQFLEEAERQIMSGSVELAEVGKVLAYK